jgi:hypothetical protein
MKLTIVAATRQHHACNSDIQDNASETVGERDLLRTPTWRHCGRRSETPWTSIPSWNGRAGRGS